MPYASESQRRLMEGVARGWKPDRIANPGRKVAQKFVAHARGQMSGKSKLSALLKVGK